LNAGTLIRHLQEKGIENREEDSFDHHAVLVSANSDKQHNEKHLPPVVRESKKESEDDDKVTHEKKIKANLKFATIFYLSELGYFSDNENKTILEHKDSDTFTSECIYIVYAVFRI
jgi:hypothetical protein